MGKKVKDGCKKLQFDILAGELSATFGGENKQAW